MKLEVVHIENVHDWFSLVFSVAASIFPNCLEIGAILRQKSRGDVSLVQSPLVIGMEATVLFVVLTVTSVTWVSGF